MEWNAMRWCLLSVYIDFHFSSFGKGMNEWMDWSGGWGNAKTRLIRQRCVYIVKFMQWFGVIY